MSRFTFDIETIPIPVIELPVSLQEEYVRRQEKRKLNNNNQEWDPHPAFNKIVAIALQYHDEKSGFPKDEKEYIARTYAGDDEKVILEKFFKALEQMHAPMPTFVGYNHLGYDVPVIIFRTLVLGIIPPGGVIWQNFTNLVRYRTSPHYDVMQWLSGWNPGMSCSLRMACSAFGIDDPKESVDGSGVEQLAALGDYNEIGAYCMRDVHATDQLYVKVRSLLG